MCGCDGVVLHLGVLWLIRREFSQSLITDNVDSNQNEILSLDSLISSLFASGEYKVHILSLLNRPKLNDRTTFLLAIISIPGIRLVISIKRLVYLFTACKHGHSFTQPTRVRKKVMSYELYLIIVNQGTEICHCGEPSTHSYIPTVATCKFTEGLEPIQRSFFFCFDQMVGCENTTSGRSNYPRMSIHMFWKHLIPNFNLGHDSTIPNRPEEKCIILEGRKHMDPQVGNNKTAHFDCLLDMSTTSISQYKTRSKQTLEHLIPENSTKR